MSLECLKFKIAGETWGSSHESFASKPKIQVTFLRKLMFVPAEAVIKALLRLQAAVKDKESLCSSSSDLKTGPIRDRRIPPSPLRRLALPAGSLRHKMWLVISGRWMWLQVKDLVLILIQFCCSLRLSEHHRPGQQQLQLLSDKNHFCWSPPPFSPSSLLPCSSSKDGDHFSSSVLLFCSLVLGASGF